MVEQVCSLLHGENSYLQERKTPMVDKVQSKTDHRPLEVFVPEEADHRAQRRRRRGESHGLAPVLMTASL